MALIHLINFNNNDAANIYDFSLNGNDAATITGLTVAASDVGYCGVFDGSTTTIDFGDINNIPGNQISAFAKINIDTDKAQMICQKSDNWRLRLDATSHVVFEVYIGGAWKTATSGEAVQTGQWTVVAGTYDGTTIKTFLDNTQDGDTAQAGLLDSSVKDFDIGSDGAGGSFFDGKIEVLGVYSNNLSDANIITADAGLADNPNGILVGCGNQSHGLETGDLISTEIYDTAIKGVVTHKVDANDYYYIPITDTFFGRQTKPVRIGNVYDTTRQWQLRVEENSDDPRIIIMDNINQFSDVLLDANVTFKVNKEGWQAGNVTESEILKFQVFSG